jgi:stromal membrane-associated protein
MRSVGNQVANEFWEANLPPDFEAPDPTNSYQMSTFIRQKYVTRRWAAAGPPPGSAPVPMHSIPVIPSSRKSGRVDKSSNEEDLIVPAHEHEHPRPRVQDKVSSADRKPGKKLPERLVRKLKKQEREPPHALPRLPPTKTAASEPNLLAIAGSSDDDDPFA